MVFIVNPRRGMQQPPSDDVLQEMFQKERVHTNKCDKCQ